MARPRHVETYDEKLKRIRNLIFIRSARTALGLSQRELAHIVEIHFSALARFESGQLRLKQNHIQKILDHFKAAGISYIENAQGDLLIQLSGERWKMLTHNEPAETRIDLVETASPRFRF